MEKNVGKIDFEELRKAREALNQEMGISSAPETTPKRKKEKKSSEETEKTEDEGLGSSDVKSDEMKAQANKDSELESKLDEFDSPEKDFSVYDNFSQFEVNTSNIYEKRKKTVVSKINEGNSFVASDTSNVAENDSLNSIDELSPYDYNEEKAIDKLLDNIDDIEEKINNENKNSQFDDYYEEKNNNSSEDFTNNDDSSDKISNNSKNYSNASSSSSSSSKSNSKSKEIDENKFTDEYIESLLKDFKFDDEDEQPLEQESKTSPWDAPQPSKEFLEQNLAKQTQAPPTSSPKTSPWDAPQQKVFPTPQKQTNDKTNDFEPFDLGNFKNEIKPNVEDYKESPSPKPMMEDYKESPSQKPIVEEKRPLASENIFDTTSELDEVKPEKPKEYLKKIDDCGFLSIIKSKAFMDSDELTCIYGIDESKNVICQNFKDFYNTVLFTENDEDIFKLFSSMMLSLTLKNSKYAMKFVVCDSKNGSKFEVFNNLSYMFFNRVAILNNEIIDSLTEIAREIDRRYEKLAKVGAKNIEEFNKLMKEENIIPMSHLLLLFNNYSRSIHLDDSEKVNTCLSYILKYGRLVGVYVNLVASEENIADNINFNLQTRISFKCESEEISMNRIGEFGAEKIGYAGEYVCKTIYSDDIIHLKVPNISKNEVELLIKNIEK